MTLKFFFFRKGGKTRKYSTSQYNVQYPQQKSPNPPPPQKKKARRGYRSDLCETEGGPWVDGRRGRRAAKKSCSISCLSLGRRRRGGSDSLILDPRNPSLSFSFLLQSGGARFSLNEQKSLFILLSPGKRGWSNLLWQRKTAKENWEFKQIDPNRRQK